MKALLGLYPGTIKALVRLYMYIYVSASRTCVCVYIYTHTRVGYIYVIIDRNISINTHTHTHTHTHKHTHTHTANQYIKYNQGQRKTNLAPVRYTTTTLTLTSKVEIIRLIKARGVCV